jgi:uncharacterized protein
MFLRFDMPFSLKISHYSRAASLLSAAGVLNPTCSGTASSMHHNLLPTEDCNFRCTYCYEDFAIGRMSRATIEAVKKLIESRVPKLRALTIGWFGGEPLIAKDIVMEISA